MSNLSPIHRKDDPTLGRNYRPNSFLCILSKAFERCVFNHCFLFLSSQLYHLQHGFLKGKPATIQLLVYHDILLSLPKSYEVDVIFLDFAKAFDEVFHQCSVNWQTQDLWNWRAIESVVKSYLTGRQQRVVLNGEHSDWLNTRAPVVFLSTLTIC